MKLTAKKTILIGNKTVAEGEAFEFPDKEAEGLIEREVAEKFEPPKKDSGGKGGAK